MEYIINFLSAVLIGLSTTYIMSLRNKTDTDNIGKIFKDLGDSVEITTSFGSFFSKPKTRIVHKSKIVTIQQAAVVSLFFKSKAVIDIFSTADSAEITKIASELFPDAEVVLIE